MTEERIEKLLDEVILEILKMTLIADKQFWPVNMSNLLKPTLRTVAAEARIEGIGEIPLRALLDWYMCSDPWPGGDQDVITMWLNKMCRARGYLDWVAAYHALPAERL